MLTRKNLDIVGRMVVEQMQVSKGICAEKGKRCARIESCSVEDVNKREAAPSAGTA